MSSIATFTQLRFLPNHLSSSLFTKDEIARIKKIKFSDIIKLVSNINDGLVPKEAFLLPSGMEMLIELKTKLKMHLQKDKINCRNSVANHWKMS